MSSKKQLLDPLGTAFKLVSLIFSEHRTKISIQEHILSLDKPHSYQFLVRMFNGDGRENISELYYVVIRIIKWYLIGDDTDADSDCSTDNVTDIFQSEEIKQLIGYLCEAFKKLQVTYETGNVVLSLQFFINILRDGLDGKFNEERLPKIFIDKDKDYENLVDYNKLKNLWDLHKIKRLCELYSNCFKTMDDEEMPYKTKRPIMESYLKSIDLILEITDNEFQHLIQNSYKH